jgi:hypothetical protein
MKSVPRVAIYIGYVGILDRLFRNFKVNLYLFYIDGPKTPKEHQEVLSWFQRRIQFKFKLSGPRMEKLACLMLRYLTKPADVFRSKEKIVDFLGLKQIFQRVFTCQNLDGLLVRLSTDIEPRLTESSESDKSQMSREIMAAKVEFKACIGLMYLINLFYKEVKLHLQNRNHAYFVGKPNPEYMLNQLRYLRTKLDTWISYIANRKF